MRRLVTRPFRLALVALLLAVATTGAAAAQTGPEPASAPAREPGLAPPLETPFLVADGVVRRTLSYGPDGLAQTVDVYSADGNDAPRPTVLLVHGGGWQIGDSTEWADSAIELVRAQGWTAVAVNYRLTTTAAWPAPQEDVAAALRLVQSRAGELGIDADRIGAIGDSAGGQLVGLLGEPGPGRPALRSVVTWSGISDLTGLTRQSSSGGCGTDPCSYSGLAERAVTELLACSAAECPATYVDASPAAAVGPGHAATLSISSEDEQVDPRQAWVLDAALSRAGVPSRVQIRPGRRHGRGLQEVAWADSLRFLAGTLTPEAAPSFPAPVLTAELSLPAESTARVGVPVPLTGSIGPRQLGSTVVLQVQQSDGSWRAARTALLTKAPGRSIFSTSWTPRATGPVTWRALWRGGGGLIATSPRTVTVR